MQKQIRTVLITDLDDTLWDWLAIWHSSFKPLFDGISAISGISEEELIPIIKRLHEEAGTSEYNFLPHGIEEHLGNPTDHQTVLSKYKSAIDTSKRERESAYKPFDGVIDTLLSIKARGTKIIAYTESQAYATVQRIKDFGLDGVIDVLYSPEDHDWPHKLTPDQVRSMDDDHYKLLHTIHKHTPKGEFKPNPAVLLDIIQAEGANPSDCVYVGDKIVKDVMMAQDANVLDVYAKYGNLTHTDEYEFLRAVTHWKAEAVKKEKSIKPDEDIASITLEEHFAELLDHIDFRSHKKKN